LSRSQRVIQANDALQRLREGNQRFVAHIGPRRFARARPVRLAKEQNPFAIILGCSDARVPAEIVFDQGLGDLFVIRIAGNIVAASQIGSIEFAVSRFGTPLVLVLGHSRCGAVEATLEALARPGEAPLPSIGFIVDQIRPGIEPVLAGDGDPMERAIRANVLASVDRLRHGSAFLQEMVDTGRLLVTGAEYSLETGVVSFFD
jgi:carbonic anhydrase